MTSEEVRQNVVTKFWVSSVKHVFGSVDPAKSEPMIQVEMMPVTNGGEENRSFSRYTPSGKIELLITNPQAFALFENGGELYVEFRKSMWG